MVTKQISNIGDGDIMVILPILVTIFPILITLPIFTSILIRLAGAKAGARLQNLLLQHVSSLPRLRHLAPVHNVQNIRNTIQNICDIHDKMQVIMDKISYSSSSTSHSSPLCLHANADIRNYGNIEMQIQIQKQIHLEKS